LHIRLQRPGEGGGELHRPEATKFWRLTLTALLRRSCRL
jgi:hypothetical protein